MQRKMAFQLSKFVHILYLTLAVFCSRTCLSFKRIDIFNNPEIKSVFKICTLKNRRTLTRFPNHQFAKLVTTQTSRVEAKQYPEDVIIQEERESPFRPVRYIFLSVCGIAGTISMGFSLAAFFGLDNSKDIVEALNIPNAFLDMAVVFAAFFMWLVEETAKRQHYKSIMADKENQRKIEKQNRPRASKSKRAMDEIYRIQTEELRASVKGQESLDVRTKEVISKSKLPLSSLKDTLAEANELGKAQAIALNNMLEEQGILEPIQKRKESPLQEKEETTNTKTMD